MSKISLEPNASGAGTFSIVSPDSNTNRTLNLPDEAGKLLSTGNNDPAEVFKQSNILGNVSESGGVPTGAVIESGSNSNGDFVKFADGTMICSRTGVPLDDFVNGRLRSGGTTFPSVFSDIPSTTISLDYTNFSSNTWLQTYSGLEGRVEGLSTTGINPHWWSSDLTSGDADDGHTFSFISVGRWY